MTHCALTSICNIAATPLALKRGRSYPRVAGTREHPVRPADLARGRLARRVAPMRPQRARLRLIALLFLALLFLALAGPSARAGAGAGPLTPEGRPADDSFFPLAVWVQRPSDAARYREIGINTYVALHRGPTAEQLDELERAGMFAITHQNERGLAARNRATIAGWMHGDEPDNAQSLGRGKGWGPPVLPER